MFEMQVGKQDFFSKFETLQVSDVNNQSSVNVFAMSVSDQIKRRQNDIRGHSLIKVTRVGV